MRYDKGGDAMYDCASALMKSLRGSDPDAALHYLARFLEAGDLGTPGRRLLCSASEDVGMAYPQAIAIVKACPKHSCRWRRRRCCSPPHRSPTA